jgi:cytochrome P450
VTIAMGNAARVYDPFSYEIDEDPYPVYRWMRDEAPVYHNAEMDFFALTRFSDNLDAFIDKDAYTSTWSTSLEFMKEPHPDSGLMIWMDPPEHNRYRGLVSKAFTPRRIADLEPRIRAIATGYLDALVGRERFDVVKEFTARLPMDVISSLLGIPESDRRWVQEGSNAMLHRDPGSPLPRPEAIEATQEVLAYFDQQIAERRARPRDDMMTLLTQVEFEDEDDSIARLSDGDIRQFLMLLATAGNETVTKLLATAYYELWSHPDERALLVRDPALVRNAVEELLRFDPPSQYQGRVATRDLVLHGVAIPKHSRVLLINGATGRDERKFPDPDRFDVRREIDVHLGLGYGRHLCLGASLARLESRVAIEELLRRFPRYEVPSDGIERMHSSNVRGLSGLVLEPTA